jgi:hypothetical protein
MKKPRSAHLRCSVSLLFSILGATAISAFAATAVKAQDSAQDEVKSSPTAGDYAAAKEATVVYRHARPANTPAGSTMKNKDIAIKRESEKSSAAPANANSEVHNDGLRFPADLSYLGGAVVVSAESHAIYLLPNGECPISDCWGNPEGFLRDLAISDFIHVADQYIGMAASNRYTVGDHRKISYKPTPMTAPLTDHDMRAVVHAVAAASGQTGYGHIYHVFLPRGQDECLPFLGPNGKPICYSPDVADTFVFCAYHSSVTFADIGHVLYTVEPFQNVSGCSVRPGIPKGQLVDSTNNSLSHEAFETITDPDGDAWFNFSSVALGGAEIGDECSFFVFVPPNSNNAFFDPSVFTIGRNRYAVQPEYANSEHACATSP